MSTCPHCRVFSGIPTCLACKTYHRIGAFLQDGRFNAYQENQVLTILRNCAGALTDLVEAGGPFGPRSAAEVGGGEREVGRSPLKEEPDKEVVAEAKPTEEEASNGEKEEEAEEGKESPKETNKEKENTSIKKPVSAKKEKKKNKKSKDKTRKKRRSSPSERKESPEIGESKKKPKKDSLKAMGSKTSPPKRDRTVSEESRKNTAEEKPQREEREASTREEPPEEEVAEDPAGSGLGHIPIRGSAGRSREEVIPAGNRRPAEPEALPAEEWDYHYDGRQYYSTGNWSPDWKAKRWKGYNHYTRGVEYWKNRKYNR